MSFSFRLLVQFRLILTERTGGTFFLSNDAQRWMNRRGFHRPEATASRLLGNNPTVWVDVVVAIVTVRNAIRWLNKAATSRAIQSVCALFSPTCGTGGASLTSQSSADNLIADIRTRKSGPKGRQWHD